MLLGCLYFLFIMMFSDRGFVKYQQLSQQMEQIELKKDALAQSIKQGQDNIHQAEEPSYIEEQARLRYGLVKKDEKVYWLPS